MAGIVTFDTHAFIKKMISTGMPEEQAETLATGLAEIVTDRLATKDDLALYHKQAEQEFTKVRGEISDMWHKTETEFAKVRGEIKDLGAELRVEIRDQGAEVRSEITEVRSEIKELDKKIDVQGAKFLADNKLIRSEMEVLGTKLGKDNEIMGKDIVIKLVGAMAVFAGLLFAALRLFPA